MFWLLLQGAGKAIAGFVSGVISFLAKHPTITACLVTALVSIGLTWKFVGERTEARVTAKYEKVLEQVRAESQARADKIAQVEADSKKAAAEAQAEITQKTRAINTIKDDYERRLAEARKNPKIKVVTVEVPGATKPAEVFVEDGTVSCRNLPSTFTTTINDMVDAANGKLLTEGKSP